MSEAPDYVDGLCDALSRQQQADRDGTLCIVSRQAVDEAIGQIRRAKAVQIKHEDELTRLRAENGKLRRLLTAAVYGPWWPSTDAEARAALAQKEGE